MNKPFLYIFLLCSSIVAYGQYSFHTYEYIGTDEGLPSRYVFDITEDKYGFIWMATPEGLVRYDGTTIEVVEKEARDSIFLQSNYISSILADGDSLWIGTRKGLSILNLKTGEIYIQSIGAFDLDSEVDINIDNAFRIWDLKRDRQGNIWIAPNYGGFVKWDKLTKKFIHFPLPEGENLPAQYLKTERTSLRVIRQDIYQDSIIWGGGLSGLVRLNQNTGQITRILYSKNERTTQFRVNRKICLHQESNGVIYTGAWNSGLSIYNPATQDYFYPTFEFPQFIPAEIKRDHLYEIIPGEDGYLYLTFNSGLYFYDIKKRQLKLLKKNKVKGDNQVHFGIEFIDSQKRAWYGSESGVVMSDPLAHQFRWYSLASFNSTPYPIIERSLVEDFYPGYLSFSGQFTDGIYHVNKSTGHTFKSEFKEYMVDHQFFSAWGMVTLNENTLLIAGRDYLYTWDKLLKRFQKYDIQVPKKYSSLSDLVMDEEGIIWLGTGRDGLFSIDTKTQEVKSHKDQVSFSQVFRAFKDQQQNIWFIGGYGHLVYNRKQERFNVFEYDVDTSATFLYGRNFCECPNGEVWLSGREDGIGLLSVHEPQKGIIKKVRLHNEEGEAIQVEWLACSSNNELWTINNKGLYKIDRNKWTVQTFSLDYGVKKWEGVFKFLKSGELLVGSRDGFYTIEPEKLLTNKCPPIPYVCKMQTATGEKTNLADPLNQTPVYLTPSEKVLTIEFSAINHTLAEKTQFAYQLEGIDKDWVDPGKKRSITYSYLPGGKFTFRLKAANNEGIWSEKVYELPIIVGVPWFKTTVFLVFIVWCILGLVYFIYLLRIKQIQKANNLKSEFEKRVADLEMNALRAQMNPHFIFNCLNSIEAYIIRNDTKRASEYLNTFGRLVRLILQNSRSSYVSLQDELHSLQLYLELEQMRFKNSFEYDILLADGLRPEEYEIPPMLIQPFIENAIWHGLNPKKEGGLVTLKIHHNISSIQCIIEDNGIGRVAAQKIRAAQKIKRKSMGLDITRDRMKTLNKVYNTKNEIRIEDLYDVHGTASGTRVTITIPF
ncbi:MAG: histidine kinase [Bacteroidota bacterium]